MESEDWRGIFTIPQSVFHDDGRFDEAGLEAELEFCLGAGAHGIVWPVMASRFAILSHQERKRTAEIVIRKVGGSAPVVIGVATVWSESSVDLARHAETEGADAIISLPPWEVKPTREQAFDYYRALSEAVTIPIFIQNAGGKFGMALPAEHVARMVRELDGVDYVKQEIAPFGQHITQVIDACGDSVKGVFGGANGRHIVDEFNRGAVGNMPACAITDVLVELYKRYARGDEPGAREVYHAIMPYLNFLRLFGMGLILEVLRRRGVVRSTSPRIGKFEQLDANDHRELDLILEGLRPYFRLQPPA